MGKADKLVEQAKAHLENGEHVQAAVMGSYETKIMGADSTRNGVLIATDRRVVFYAKKLGGFDLESFPYGNISSFEHGKSMMGHSITFHASGNRVSVKWLQPASEFADFLEVVKAAMSGKDASAPAAAPEVSAGPDVMQQLKQLGELRDAGVVTPEEFEAKKAELLRRI
ncbi:PH domain-containing protein [Microbacterium sp. zg.Y909]|uniref:PH domain-containing protein n=1 Tax=Microbacterium sp. zg.Y909 TaxID=2969413 RepID=UPI00214C200F|nr:PH domain-containing protein [Microbacterium sp. zg.Y909]MCR2825376.1 PH domain-containing protein [Microbacterium sp. zg.Y909]